jgi:alpha-beta hydrolase superfamily lysophospholipase
MNPSVPSARDHEWLDYYGRFNYFSVGAVRDGCQPRIMEHQHSPEKAIVLVHGLRDSPYFMTPIGHYFFEKLGYNVYLPLLHCHGLREPKGMEGVKLDEWKANVNFAVDTAKSKVPLVAIGGLVHRWRIKLLHCSEEPSHHWHLVSLLGGARSCGRSWRRCR